MCVLPGDSEWKHPLFKLPSLSQIRDRERESQLPPAKYTRVTAEAGHWFPILSSKRESSRERSAQLHSRAASLSFVVVPSRSISIIFPLLSSRFRWGVPPCFWDEKNCPFSARKRRLAWAERRTEAAGWRHLRITLWVRRGGREPSARFTRSLWILEACLAQA